MTLASFASLGEVLSSEPGRSFLMNPTDCSLPVVTPENVPVLRRKETVPLGNSFLPDAGGVHPLSDNPLSHYTQRFSFTQRRNQVQQNIAKTSGFLTR